MVYIEDNFLCYFFINDFFIQNLLYKRIFFMLLNSTYSLRNSLHYEEFMMCDGVSIFHDEGLFFLPKKHPPWKGLW